MTASASNQGYGQTAADLIPQYEALDFAEVHAPVLHLYPAAPAEVLDIGAGTGRDAAALARLGHRVTAAEPTTELRAWGEQAHAGLGIRWVDDMLPGLPALQALGQRYDLVLLTAVWMHLDAQERAEGIAALARLLQPGGRLAFSLRHGPVPEGRRMFDVSGEELVRQAAPHGLVLVDSFPAADVQGRPGVRWTRLVLQAGGTQDAS